MRIVANQTMNLFASPVYSYLGSALDRRENICLHVTFRAKEGFHLLGAVRKKARPFILSEK